MPYPSDNLYPAESLYPSDAEVATPVAPAVLAPATIITPKWRFRLLNSFDMSTIGLLEQASGRKLSVILNKPGKADFTYPMEAPYAHQIVPYKTGILAERFNWRATVLHHEAGNYGEIWDPLWSGYVLPIDEDWTNNRMAVSCVGWLTRLEKRILRAKYQATNKDDGLIIADLLQAANGSPAGPSYVWPGGTTSYVAPDGYTIRWKAGSSPNTPTWVKWGGQQPNEGPGGSTSYVTATRNFKLEKDQAIGPAIDTLINLENGCDVYVDPVTRALTVHRRYRRVLPNVVMGHKWGPKNAAQFTRTQDSDLQANYIRAQGETGTVPQYADNVSSMSEIGPIEEVHQLAGVKDNQILLAFAGAEIIVRGDGLVTYGVTPFHYTSTGSVPEPFVDYRPGDQIYVTARHSEHPAHGTHSIERQAVRVFGFDISMDDQQGNEILGQLQLSP